VEHQEPVLQRRVRPVPVARLVAAAPVEAVPEAVGPGFPAEAHREVAAALAEREADKPGRSST
jgi:hypothetical protein